MGAEGDNSEDSTSKERKGVRRGVVWLHYLLGQDSKREEVVSPVSP